MACYFCQRNIQEIDFKDIKILEKFTSGLKKIRPKKELEFVPVIRESSPKLLREQDF